MTSTSISELPFSSNSATMNSVKWSVSIRNLPSSAAFSLQFFSYSPVSSLSVRHSRMRQLLPSSEGTAIASV